MSENRLDAFGRAAMRAVIALDARVARAGDDGLFAHEGGGIITVRRLLPDWAIRLLVGTLLLPPLLTAIDAFFGARRRRLPVVRWIGWVAAAACRSCSPGCGCALLGLAGALAAPPGRCCPTRCRSRLADRGAGLGAARARARLARAAARARVRAAAAGHGLGRRRGGGPGRS